MCFGNWVSKVRAVSRIQRNGVGKLMKLCLKPLNGRALRVADYALFFP